MFKPICIIAALSVGPASAQGEQHLCMQYGALSQAIMIARQNDAPINNVLAVMTKDSFKAFVLLAYTQPLYKSWENKNRAVRDFRSKVQTACFKEFL